MVRDMSAKRVDAPRNVHALLIRARADAEGDDAVHGRYGTQMVAFVLPALRFLGEVVRKFTYIIAGKGPVDGFGEFLGPLDGHLEFLRCQVVVQMGFAGVALRGVDIVGLRPVHRRERRRLDIEGFQEGRVIAEDWVHSRCDPRLFEFFLLVEIGETTLLGPCPLH